MPTIEVTEKELTLIKGALAGVAGIQGAWNPKHHNLEMYRELMNLKDKIEGQESKPEPKPEPPTTEIRKY